MSGEVATLDAVPEQQHQLLIDIVASDPDVKESRAANTLVLKPGDLTTGEKMALVDLASMFITVNECFSDQPKTDEYYQIFLEGIFKDWASSDGENDPPILPPRKLPGVNAQVGVLNIDHPEPVDEAEKPTQQSAARLAGAPALLDIMMWPEFETVYGQGPWKEPIWEETLWGGDIRSPSMWAYLWRDQDGHPLKHEFVQFAEGVTMKDAVLRAIAEYDQNEATRVVAYNREVIVNAARRRISKWAKDGTGAAPRVDEDDRLAKWDMFPSFLLETSHPQPYLFTTT